VDFYCSKAKLVIEVDGDSHNTKDGIEYDEQRTAVLESFGLEVIRFTNDEVLFDFNKVCEQIIETITIKSGISREELL
jgi:very-short-patch-repair endonuclease